MRSNPLLNILSLLFVLVLSGIFNHSIAQNGNQKKLLYAADDAFYNQNYREALRLYHILDSMAPNDREYFQYQQGLAYLYSNIDNKKAIENILAAEKKMAESEIADLYYYHLGRAYHINNKFDKAVVAYQTAQSMEIFDDEFKSELERQIIVSQNAKKIVANRLNFKIANTGRLINSKYPDYKPVISADGSVIIFTSRRKGTVSSKPKKAKDKAGNYYEDIFIVLKDKDNFWTEPRSISSNVNSISHEASVGLSPDGRELIIYKGNPNAGGLYVSKLDGADWTVPEVIDKGNQNINAKKSWETSASITADGKTIYFTSNRKDGFGGLDMYMSVKNDAAEWGVAKNLGPIVNTLHDEESPFIHPDGKTLYFSSRGHNNIGGYDIFKTRFENGQWSEPTNLGYPLNSTSDDLHFVLTANGKNGYFTSSRSGSMGEQDIYKAYLEEKVAPLVLIKGLIKTEDDGPINVTIKVINTQDKKRQKYVYSPNKITGKYLMILPHGKNYDMLVSADGYDPYMLNLNIPTQDEFYELYQEIDLRKIKVFGDTIGQDIVVVNSFENLRNADKMKEEIGASADPSILLDIIAEIVETSDSLSLKELSEGVSAKLDKQLAQISEMTDEVTENFEAVKEADLHTEAVENTRLYTDEHVDNLELVEIDDEAFFVIPSQEFEPADITIEKKTTIDESDLVPVVEGEDTAYILPAAIVFSFPIDKKNLIMAVEDDDTTYIIPPKLIESPSEVLSIPTFEEKEIALVEKASKETDKKLVLPTKPRPPSIVKQQEVAEIIVERPEEISTEEIAIVTEKPEETATATEKPEETATATEKPEETATVTEKPEETATATEKPEETVTVTEKPEETTTATEKPEETASVTEKPEETASVTEKPEETTSTVTKEQPTEKETETSSTATPMPKSKVVLEKNVLFGFDKASVTNLFSQDLDNVAAMLNKFPAYSIEIAGHTDSKGQESYNVNLSRRRAQAVANYLNRKGIAKNRMKVAGYGEARPISPNTNPDGSDNPTGRKRNRRTEIKITG